MNPMKKETNTASTTLYLLRHGETEENAAGIFQGQRPGHLSQQGKQQAQARHEEVTSMHFDAILCSDLQRCKDTAAIVLQGSGATPIYTPLLRERDMGNLTGMRIAGTPLNETVENAEQVATRARAFLRLVEDSYKGQTLLVISHGYFCRILQAVIEQKSYREVPKMENCELRRIVV